MLIQLDEDGDKEDDPWLLVPPPNPDEEPGDVMVLQVAMVGVNLVPNLDNLGSKQRDFW